MADLVIDESEKVCSRCGRSKRATTEFFSPKRAALNTRCKVCVAEVGRLRWSDPDYHAKQMAKRAIKYAEPPFQEKERSRQRARQADPAHIAKEAARQQRRKADPVHQANEVQRGRKRREHEEYRAKVRNYVAVSPILVFVTGGGRRAW